MYKHNDLSGQCFSRLKVICENGRSKDRHIMWLCECECGNTKSISSKDLVSGHSKSCGCRQKEIVSANRKIHGDRDARLYSVWKTMKKRCENRNHHSYKYYGAKGVRVCDEWQDYSNFKEWAFKNGYDEKAPFGVCTIDRINPCGNYEPSNCRWVGMDVQARNKRSYMRGEKT